MPLRGKKPKEVSNRLKLMMYSLAGVGKTTAAIQMPKPYIIDTERGADKKEYVDKIVKADGVYFGASDGATDPDEVLKEVRELATTKHDYLTIVIDSFTPLFEAKQEEGVGLVGDSYGRHTDYANRWAKRLLRMLTLADMNVIVTSHAKDEWSGGERVGIKFDGFKKLDYLFDLVLELERRGKARYAINRKTRFAEFPDQEAFEWSYKALAERWGATKLTREVEAVKMAVPEQVDALTRKIKALNLPPETIQKWLKKADAETFDDMTGDVITSCLIYCDKKLKEAGDNAVHTEK